MKTIWKFPFPDTREFELEMPIGASILCVKVKEGKGNLWAIVDPEAKKCKRKFRVFGTGWDFPDDGLNYLEYVGSYIEQDFYIWHVFQDLEEV